MNTYAFFALVRKDLRLFFTDKRSLMMSFAAPIAIASFFGFVLGGPTDRKASRIPVWIVDQDQSGLSKKITDQLANDSGLELRSGDLALARAEVQSGKARVAVIISSGFGERAGRAMFGAGEKPALELLYDPSRSPEAQMVKGILTGAIMQQVGKEVFGGETGRVFLDDSKKWIDQATLPEQDKSILRDLFRSVERWNQRTDTAGAAQPGPAAMQTPYDLKEEAVAAPGVKYNSFAHSFTGMGVQFILFMGIEAGVSILLQRQRGLWKRLRAAPISRATLLGSRSLSAAICALIILAVLFSFAWLVFDVRVEGSFAGFIGVALAFALMTSSFGLLIASFGKTPEATRPLAIFATLVMVMLGGSWVPSFLFPEWLQKATLAVPTRWAVDGLNGMTWRGLGLDQAIMPMIMLAGFSLLFGAIAIRRFRWEVD